jgi:hypothetical protein
MPGPPFHTNVSGRAGCTGAPSSVYAMKNMCAWMSPVSLSRIGIRPARAVYLIALPSIVI